MVVEHHYVVSLVVSGEGVVSVAIRSPSELIEKLVPSGQRAILRLIEAQTEFSGQRKHRFAPLAGADNPENQRNNDYRDKNEKNHRRHLESLMYICDFPYPLWRAQVFDLRLSLPQDRHAARAEQIIYDVCQPGNYIARVVTR
jgi:hypothetical protein